MSSKGQGNCGPNKQQLFKNTLATHMTNIMYDVTDYRITKCAAHSGDIVKQ